MHRPEEPGLECQEKLPGQKTLDLSLEEWVHVHQAKEEACCQKRGQPLPSLRDTREQGRVRQSQDGA
ncbi:hypothetical protein DF277_15775 [Listeria monocytogenes]|nr:hypothetical protein DF277_15775 [Listeria monocytogenes]